MAPPTCRLVTLGCKVNQYETQYVREMLEGAGYVVALEGEPADLCVVNTCTVTAEGDAKGRQLIGRLHRTNPRAALVVMGCYATRDPDAVRRLPGVTDVVTDKARILDELRPYGVAAAPAGISRFDDHQRAFVKVQDGCLLNCSYCIIPSVRPTVRSRTPEEIEEEVARLCEAGYREVVLTGIHLGHYGIDLSRGRPKGEWVRLGHLLERLARMPGDFRVRLSSLEAAEARDDLVRALATLPRVCPHLHLCLQSGSDSVLGRMRRRYRSASFVERCRRIGDTLDHPALTTDVIVGFPGETDDDFEATCRVVREVGFAKVHIFSYSTREGTPAAAYPDALPPAVVRERRRRLQVLADEVGERYARSLVGRRLDVLVESADPERTGFVRGTACRAVTVSLRGHLPALIRQCVPVRAVGVADGVVVGEPEPEDGIHSSTPVWRTKGGRLALPTLA